MTAKAAARGHATSTAVPTSSSLHVALGNGDRQSSAALELDVDPRIGAEVLHVGDGARRDHVVRRPHPGPCSARVIRSGRTVCAPPTPSRRLDDSSSSRLEVPTKLADERCRRMLVDLAGRADLFEPAMAEDGDPRAHRQRLALVVGDEDERDAHLALDRAQLDLHLLAELEVERAEWLVEQQHPRLVDERSGERHPLALPAGQLVGSPRAVVRTVA